MPVKVEYIIELYTVIEIYIAIKYHSMIHHKGNCIYLVVSSAQASNQHRPQAAPYSWYTNTIDGVVLCRMHCPYQVF